MSVLNSPFVKTPGAAEHLQVGRSTLEKYRIYGGGPKFSKLGKSVVYRVSDLEAWAASRIVGSTSEADTRRGKSGGHNG